MGGTRFPSFKCVYIISSLPVVAKVFERLTIVHLTLSSIAPTIGIQKTYPNCHVLSRTPKRSDKERERVEQCLELNDRVLLWIVERIPCGGGNTMEM